MSKLLIVGLMICGATVAHAEETGPIKCFKSASKVLIFSSEKIALCAGATSDEPVKCFNEAATVNDTGYELKDSEKINLCKTR